MAERRQAGLHAGVEANALAGTIFGNVVSGAFLVLGVAAATALGLTPAAFVIAGTCFVLTTLSYVEGITMLPTAGGSSSFARRAFNELVSFLAGWALILDYMIMIAFSAFFAAHYLAALPHLDPVGEHPWHLVFGVVLIGIVALVNVRAVQLGASISIVLSMIALVTEAVLVVVGLFMVFDPQVLTSSMDLSMGAGWSELAFALPIAMIGFSGLEIAANMSGELSDAAHELPRPMVLSAAISVMLLVLLSVIGLSALPVHAVDGGYATLLGLPHTQGGYQTLPLVGIVEHLGLSGGLERIAVTYVVILALGILFLAAASGVTGLSRLAYSMSLHRQIPSQLARIERGAGTPNVAVLAFALLAAGLLVLVETLRSSAIVLAQLYAFGAMFSFIVANASIIWLRVLEPDLPRPFRSPWNVRIKGREIPLASVAGLVLSLLMWLLVVFTHDAARTLGAIWMVAGFVAYGTYRLTRGMTLTERYSPRVRAPMQLAGVPYRRVLMAVRPERGVLWGAGDAELAALANKLLDDPQGEVAVVTVHEVPLRRPLNEPLGDVEQATVQRLSMIRSVTDKLGVRLSSSAQRGRAAGRTICQEAARRGSDVIVMATREKRRHGGQAFGKTVDYVIRHAPCDVVVMRFPAASLDGSGEQR